MSSTAVLYDRIIDLEFRYNETKVTNTSTSSLEWVDGTLPNASVLTFADGSSKSQIWQTKNLRTTTDEKKSIKLICPRYGKKPKIEFEWSRVPGNFVYECNITVYNLYLQINPAWVDEIVVNAGYTSQFGINQARFTCQVFSSFTPEPSPDGYTVFQCIIATADSSIFERYYQLSVTNNPQDWTVEDVLKAVAEKMHFKLTYHLSRQLLNAKFVDIPNTVTHLQEGIGYALLSNLQSDLNVVCQRIFDKVAKKIVVDGKEEEEYIYHEVTTTVYSDAVYFVEIFDGAVVADETSTEQANLTTVTQSYVNMDLVTSVDWNAGVINITAPWNPNVAPGTIFKIDPRVYKGSYALPNDVVRQGGQRSKNDLYYVITQTCKFSTIGDNQMTLMAVPYANSPAVGENLDMLERIGITEKELQTRRENMAKSKAIEIKLGEPSNNPEDKLDGTLRLSDSQTQDYEIKSGDTLNNICLRFEPLEATNGDKVAASIAWFPVVIYLTYTRMLDNKDDTKGRWQRYWSVNMGNPEIIDIGMHLLLPNNLKWKDLQQSSYKSKIADCIKRCAEFYVNFGKKDYANQLNKAYNLFTQGVLK